MSTILHLQRYISNSSDTRLLIFSGLAAAGVGALGSLFGGIFGKKGSDKTNQMNLQIARETNQANRENQEYQNAWNLEQWNRENEYNSPLEKRKRLEAAGLNPIFYGLDGVANAGSLQSAPFTAVNGAPMLNSGAFMANGIANAAKTAAEIQLMQSQAKKNDKETEVTELERRFKEATLGSDIAVGNMNVRVTQSIIDMNEEQRKVFCQSIEESNAKIADYNSQITTRSKQMEIADFTARVDADYKKAMSAIAQQHADNETTRIANDLMIALKQLNIAMFDAQTRRGELDLKNSQWAKYLEKEYGLDMAIKNGQLFVTAAEFDGKIHAATESHLRALKLVKDITYGEGSLGQSAFMLDHVVTTNGLPSGMYSNSQIYLHGHSDDFNDAVNKNVKFFNK